MPPLIHLRAETKPGEKRTPLLPEGVKALRDAGFSVHVERSSTRCVADSAYEAAGATLVAADSWRKLSGRDTYVLGLKELENDAGDGPLPPVSTTHIFFAHAYKYQADWKTTVSRFVRGGGRILDIEYAVTANGRRIAAFGHSAGFVGAAVGLLAWAAQDDGKMLQGPLEYADSNDQLVARTKAAVAARRAKSPKLAAPRMHIVGALGRVGTGARDLCKAVGIVSIDWDMNETKAGGPFPELLDSEIVLNAILLDATNPPPPFLTKSTLDAAAGGKRRATVLADVSCDASNPTNPVPLYSSTTTLVKPVWRERADPLPFDIIAIDHLPALVPSGASVEFARALLPYLVNLRTDPDGVWARTEARFDAKVAELAESEKGAPMKRAKV